LVGGRGRCDDDWVDRPMSRRVDAAQSRMEGYREAGDPEMYAGGRIRRRGGRI
jgi:hypothetical protein